MCSTCCLFISVRSQAGRSDSTQWCWTRTRNIVFYTVCIFLKYTNDPMFKYYLSIKVMFVFVRPSVGRAVFMRYTIYVYLYICDPHGEHKNLYIFIYLFQSTQKAPRIVWTYSCATSVSISVLDRQSHTYIRIFVCWFTYERMDVQCMVWPKWNERYGRLLNDSWRVCDKRSMLKRVIEYPLHVTATHTVQANHILLLARSKTHIRSAYLAPSFYLAAFLTHSISSVARTCVCVCV